MSKISMTVRQIKDLGLWDKVCEYKDINPWAINEGSIEYDDVIEFDTEFKEEDKLKEYLKYKQNEIDIIRAELTELVENIDYNGKSGEELLEDFKTIYNNMDKFLSKLFSNFDDEVEEYE